MTDAKHAGLHDAAPFFLRPLEPLYFGPPSSFAAGDVLSGRTQFPPSPWTFQGMVRSRLLAAADPPLDLQDRRQENRRTIAKLVGKPEALPGGWQLAGPLPADHDENGLLRPWIAAPRHLLCDHATGTLVLAHPLEPVHAGRSDLAPAGKGRVLGVPGLPHARPFGGWVAPETLWKVLSGCSPNWQDIRGDPKRRLPPFVHDERRVGLAVDRGQARARGGLIYTRDHLRFEKDCGLVGWLKADLGPRLRFDALTTGTQGAGRGGRKVACEAAGPFAEHWAKLLAGKHLSEAVDDGMAFWLVSTAPVRVGDGSVGQVACHPDGLPTGVALEIEAALCGRPLVLGGFSMARGESRANQVYAPAGSAWLARLRGGDAAARAKALRALNDSHLLGPRDEAPFGFGHVLVGLAAPATRGGNDGA